MITDAYNYVNRAIAFSSFNADWLISDFVSGESINLIPAPYNTGTSVFFTLFISILGKKALFITPLFQVVLSIALLSLTIKRNKYNQSSLAVLGLSLALMFFSRSAMSCMPSFLMISVVCFLFFRPKISRKIALSIAVCSALGFWFRESNLFLTAPFLIYCLSKDIKYFTPIVLGFVLGLCPKVIADLVVYDSFWFTSASSGFSISSLWDHLPEYGIILLVFIPLSIMFVGIYKGKADKTIKVATAAFILLYLVYNYSAVDYSGLLKGSLLTSRFMIPLLPIVVVCCSEVVSRSKLFQKVFIGFSLLSILVIPLSQYVFHKLYESHEQAAIALAKNVKDKKVFADFSGFTNIIRYYNPLTTEIENISSIQNLHKKQVLGENEIIILSRSVASEEKTMRMDSMKNIVDHIPLKLTKSIEIDESNWLEIYENQ
jgi:hypothetical protein